MPQVAIAQTPATRLSDWPQTLDMIEAQIRSASQQAADLLVLPECVWPAYVLGRAGAYEDALAAGMPDHPAVLGRVAAWARDARVYVCLGHVEAAGGRLYNAATLFANDGRVLGSYRKCFLWGFDHVWFTAGDSIRPIDTPLGRIGIMICADARQPEILATLAARGAELVLQPTAWVNVGTPQNPWNPQPEFILPARAAEFGVPIASASKWGVEGDTLFVGSSLICDAQGGRRVQCGPRDTRVLAADVPLGRPRPPRIDPATRRTLVRAACPVVRVEACASYSGADSIGVRLAVEEGDAEDWLEVDRPFDGIRTMAGVRVAAVTTSSLACFAPLRALALDGADLVICLGPGADERFARTRAAENRLFVVLAEAGGVRVIAPSGQFIDDAPPRLAIAQARDKRFVARTDALADRRPGIYGF